MSAGLAQAAPTRFAIIGDYGVDNTAERAVADLVKDRFEPEFIVTTGDNNYAGPGEYDRVVGKYFYPFIGDYRGAHGAGASSNCFFPALGNHDFFNDGYAAYRDYFTLPGNERYYEVQRGPVAFFILNSDVNEPDGIGAQSAQAHWLSNRLWASRSPWKIVVVHHPPYSSSGSSTTLRWPYAAWGAQVVLAGHRHNYERLDFGNCVYVVNGIGGAGLEGFGTPLPQSRARFSAAYGAMVAHATEHELSMEFWSVTGTRPVDAVRLGKPRLRIVPAVGGLVRVSWPTNVAGFELESAEGIGASAEWTPVNASEKTEGDETAVLIEATGTQRQFRLRKP